MRAIVYTQYGPPEVLQPAETEKPVPGNKQLLIKIKATAVNSGDWRLRKADPFAVRLIFGLTKPRIKILGGVFSGEIENTGAEVTKFKKGDFVFGSTDMKFGAYAEYMCVNEDSTLALKPDNLSHQQAAVIPFGATTALHFIKKAHLAKGQKVLINGASGAVGTAAIQLAKYYGAEVTAICSTANHALVKELGADKVIDYANENFAESSIQYDVIFDTVNKLSVSAALKALKKNGLLILSAAGASEMLNGIFSSLLSSKKVLSGVIKQTAEDIQFLKELAEAGKLKPVIDRTYPLREIAAAHAYAEQGHKKGNISIEI